MPTRRETVLHALLAVLQAIPAATVLRGAVLPERIPAGGLVILRDGDPGAPEVLLSPPAYLYEHRVEIEAIVEAGTPADRDAAFDALIAAVGAAIADNRTLGGLCDWVEAEAPEPADLAVEGAAGLKAAVIPVMLIYATSDPLA